TMAQLGYSLTAETMDSTATPDANQLAWELDAARSTLHDTPEGHAVVVHRVEQAHDGPEGAQVYFFASQTRSSAIAISHSDDPGEYTRKPWLVIGRNAEEYWA